jgi:hypothetical protein
MALCGLFRVSGDDFSGAWDCPDRTSFSTHDKSVSASGMTLGAWLEWRKV